MIDHLEEIRAEVINAVENHYDERGRGVLGVEDAKWLLEQITAAKAEVERLNKLLNGEQQSGGMRERRRCQSNLCKMNGCMFPQACPSDD